MGELTEPTQPGVKEGSFPSITRHEIATQTQEEVQTIAQQGGWKPPTVENLAKKPTQQKDGTIAEMPLAARDTLTPGQLDRIESLPNKNPGHQAEGQSVAVSNVGLEPQVTAAMSAAAQQARGNLEAQRLVDSKNEARYYSPLLSGKPFEPSREMHQPSYRMSDSQAFTETRETRPVIKEKLAISNSLAEKRKSATEAAEKVEGRWFGAKKRYDRAYEANLGRGLDEQFGEDAQRDRKPSDRLKEIDQKHDFSASRRAYAEKSQDEILTGRRENMASVIHEARSNAHQRASELFARNPERFSTMKPEEFVNTLDKLQEAQAVKEAAQEGIRQFGKARNEMHSLLGEGKITEVLTRGKELSGLDMRADETARQYAGRVRAQLDEWIGEKRTNAEDAEREIDKLVHGHAALPTDAGMDKSQPDQPSTDDGMGTYGWMQQPESRPTIARDPEFDDDHERGTN